MTRKIRDKTKEILSPTKRMAKILRLGNSKNQ